jgi:two-component system nitrogen regulation sensor histidine kinase GlnL
MSKSQEQTTVAVHPSIIQFQNQDQQIIEFHKVGLLGSVLSSLIHELNQPLTSMSMDADFLTLLAKNPTKLSAEQICDVGEGLQKDVQRSQKILDELRNFAQRKQKMGEVNLNNVLKSCLTLTNERIRTHGITFEINLDPDIPPITGIKNDLQFALLNLILNSCNLVELFVTGENEYEDHMKHKFVPEISIQTKMDNGDVVLELADNGLELTEELKKSLQAPFTMMMVTNKQLLGGLYLTDVLVEKNNGTFCFDHRTMENFGGSVNFYEIRFKAN